MSKLIYKELRSKRLILRLPIETDFNAHYEYLKNPLNYPFADYKIAKSLTDVHDFFEKMLKEQLINSLFWMIAIKESNEPIGTISAWNVNWDEMTIEFGYSLYPNYRGFGYMKEAIQKVIDFLEKENNFKLFDIWTDKKNITSLKLAESLGFKHLGYEVEKAHNSERNIEYATYRLDLRKANNMNIKHEEINYKNYGKCLKISTEKGNRLYFLSCIKCRNIKEECPPLF